MRVSSEGGITSHWFSTHCSFCLTTAIVALSGGDTAQPSECSTTDSERAQEEISEKGVWKGFRKKLCLLPELGVQALKGSGLPVAVCTTNENSKTRCKNFECLKNMDYYFHLFSRKYTKRSLFCWYFQRFVSVRFALKIQYQQFWKHWNHDSKIDNKSCVQKVRWIIPVSKKMLCYRKVSLTQAWNFEKYPEVSFQNPCQWVLNVIKTKKTSVFQVSFQAMITSASAKCECVRKTRHCLVQKTHKVKAWNTCNKVAYKGIRNSDKPSLWCLWNQSYMTTLHYLLHIALWISILLINKNVHTS